MDNNGISNYTSNGSNDYPYIISILSMKSGWEGKLWSIIFMGKLLFILSEVLAQIPTSVLLHNEYFFLAHQIRIS